MASSRLTEIVRAKTPEAEIHLIPVIEKELLHYAVLDALEKLSLLERLVFHGGTCLRLCYGAQRRSEDLDFAYQGNLDELDLAGLEATVGASLDRKFGLKAVVRPPRKTVQFANATMQRWWMVVDTAPERPDLPSQKLKIELVSVETFTKEIRRVVKNYDYLSPSAGNTLAICEKREEILADKMVALVNTPPTYARKRDVWDMMYLLSLPGLATHEALSLVRKKMDLYGCNLPNEAFADEGVRRVRTIAESPEFAKEMRRFLPEGVFEEMVGSEMKLRFAVDEVCGLYQSWIIGILRG